MAQEAVPKAYRDEVKRGLLGEPTLLSATDKGSKAAGVAEEAVAQPEVPAEMTSAQLKALGAQIEEGHIPPELVEVLAGIVGKAVSVETSSLVDARESLLAENSKLREQRDRVIKAMQEAGIECDAASWDRVVVDRISKIALATGDAETAVRGLKALLAELGIKDIDQSDAVGLIRALRQEILRLKARASAQGQAIPAAPDLTGIPLAAIPRDVPLPRTESVTGVARAAETLGSPEKEQQLRRFLKILRGNLDVGRKVNARNRSGDYATDVGDKIMMNQWGFLGTVVHREDSRSHVSLLDCGINTGAAYEYTRINPKDYVDLTVLEKGLGLTAYTLISAASVLQDAVCTYSRISSGNLAKRDSSYLESRYQPAATVWDQELITACRRVELKQEDPSPEVVDEIIRLFGKIDEEEFIKRIMALRGK